MVIGPGKSGISAFVILADGEFIPANFNSEKVVVFRRGESTNRELKIVKEFGKLASPELLKPPVAPVCNFTDGPGVDSPLHRHDDGTWWYYDESWVYEEGPFNDQALGHAALMRYCEEVLVSREKRLDIIEEVEDTPTWENEGGNG